MPGVAGDLVDDSVRDGRGVVGEPVIEPAEQTGRRSPWPPRTATTGRVRRPVTVGGAGPFPGSGPTQSGPGRHYLRAARWRRVRPAAHRSGPSGRTPGGR